MVAGQALMWFLAGIGTGLFMAITVWAIGEVRTVENWNK